MNKWTDFVWTFWILADCVLHQPARRKALTELGVVTFMAGQAATDTVAGEDHQFKRTRVEDGVKVLLTHLTDANKETFIYLQIKTAEKPVVNQVQRWSKTLHQVARIFAT